MKSTQQHVVQQQSTPKNKMWVTNIKVKPVDLFDGTKRAFTLAPAII